MNNKFKIIRFSLIAISIIIVVVISSITWNVIYETKEPALFSIDFAQKSNIVSSYGTLIGVFLTFLSIIFIIYTLIQQKEQYESDRFEEKKKVKSALFDRLKLVYNLLYDISNHIEATGNQIKEFCINEKETPLKNNMIIFYSNKNYYRLLELDYLSIFSSFQEYNTEEDKTKSLNELYKLVDFYSESLFTIDKNFKKHLKDKHQRKKMILNQLGSVMDDAAIMIEEYNTELPRNAEWDQLNQWHQLLTKLVSLYMERIPEDEEIDFEIMNNEVLHGFLIEAQKVNKKIGYEKNMQSLIVQISGIKKQLYTLKKESIIFGENMNKSYNNSFSIESETYRDLNALIVNIKLIINNELLKKNKNI